MSDRGLKRLFSAYFAASHTAAFSVGYLCGEEDCITKVKESVSKFGKSIFGGDKSTDIDKADPNNSEVLQDDGLNRESPQSNDEAGNVQVGSSSKESEMVTKE